MKQSVQLGAVLGLVMSASTFAAPSTDEMWEIIQKQQAEIERLKGEQEATDKKVEATADAIESSGGGVPKSLEWATKTTIGGYAEHHYNNVQGSSDEVDAHRFVLFLGHKFSDNVRMFSEFELEHSLAGDGKPGEVELEQAYIEWDYAKGHSLVSGLYLIPVGILNETHEPNTFYGVERNGVEKRIIPTTWWETGLMFKGEIAPGFSYNFAMHSGLLAQEDGSVSIRSGRQKSAEAVANDFAYTGRLKYTAIPGLELSATLQYQEDVSQAEDTNDASATLLETHAIYEVGMFGLRALYAQWDVDGDVAAAERTDEQKGWYIEPSIKPLENVGVFARWSKYNMAAGDSASAIGTSTNEYSEYIDVGVNIWLTPEVVFKADYQDARTEGDSDTFNLGVGWSF